MVRRPGTATCCRCGNEQFCVVINTADRTWIHPPEGWLVSGLEVVCSLRCAQPRERPQCKPGDDGGTVSR